MMMACKIIKARQDCLNSIFIIFYQELLKEKSNPQLKGNRKGIIVKDK